MNKANGESHYDTNNASEELHQLQQLLHDLEQKNTALEETVSITVWAGAEKYSEHMFYVLPQYNICVQQ